MVRTIINTALSFVVLVSTTEPLSACAVNRRFSCGNNVVCAPPVRRAAVVVEKEIVQDVIPQNVTQNFFYETGQELRYQQVPSQNVIAAERQQLVREMQRLQDRMTEFDQYSRQSAQQYAGLSQQSVVACIPLVLQGLQQYSQQTQTQVQSQQLNQQQYSILQPQAGVVTAKCVRCHGGAAGVKGGLDLTKTVSCEERLKAIRLVLSGKMPKGGPPLTDDEAMKFLDEITNVFDKQPQELPPPHTKEAPQGVEAANSSLNAIRQMIGR